SIIISCNAMTPHHLKHLARGAAALALVTGLAAVSPKAASAQFPADRPAPRNDANSILAHEQLLAKRTQGKIDVYYIGDSITRRWGATDYPEFLENWRK